MFLQTVLTEARANAFFIDKTTVRHSLLALFKKLEECDRLHFRRDFLRKTIVLKTTTALARDCFEKFNVFNALKFISLG